MLLTVASKQLVASLFSGATAKFFIGSHIYLLCHSGHCGARLRASRCTSRMPAQPSAYQHESEQNIKIILMFRLLSMYRITHGTTKSKSLYQKLCKQTANLRCAQALRLRIARTKSRFAVQLKSSRWLVPRIVESKRRRGADQSRRGCGFLFFLFLPLRGILKPAVLTIHRKKR